MLFFRSPQNLSAFLYHSDVTLDSPKTIGRSSPFSTRSRDGMEFEEEIISP